MTIINLHLHKMATSLDSESMAQYHLKQDNCSDSSIHFNKLIGKDITITFLNEIHCIACGRKTNKSFNQGYCFPCVRTLAQCDMCILKPEQCHFDEGTCREPQWGLEHCFQPHYVYLANTGNIKVGITRGKNIPTRWIDQGASYALPMYKVDRRLTSGLVEIILKTHISDKTNWRTMLKAKPEYIDLIKKRAELHDEIQSDLMQITDKHGIECLSYLPHEKIVKIDYPIREYPKKITSFNLDKNPTIKGTLIGIKGQYLILDTGVINIRKYSGYHCKIEKN